MGHAFDFAEHTENRERTHATRAQPDNTRKFGHLVWSPLVWSPPPAAAAPAAALDAAAPSLSQVSGEHRQSVGDEKAVRHGGVSRQARRRRRSRRSSRSRRRRRGRAASACVTADRAAARRRALVLAWRADAAEAHARFPPDRLHTRAAASASAAAAVVVPRRVKQHRHAGGGAAGAAGAAGAVRIHVRVERRVAVHNQRD